MNEYNWIDECFRVQQKRFGTWVSYDKDNVAIITSLTEDECIHGTRFYLKGKQEGWNVTNNISYGGEVQNKL
jgi:hypothetical protein